MVSAGDKALALGPALVVVCAMACPLAGCKIVYDDDQKKASSSTVTDLHAADLDASAWVASVWSRRTPPSSSIRCLSPPMS